MRGVRHLLALGTAAVCGVLLYCLRLRFPNPLTEALGPANASPWETGKLVFWAMLPAAAVLPSMMAELAVYGLVTALVMRLVHTGRLYGDLYIALCCAIPCGRIVAGVVKALTFPAGSWSMAAWVSAHILISWPGTLIQLALLPTLVVALTKARLVPPRY